MTIEGYVKVFKKGDVLPEGAVLLDQSEIARIQKKRFRTLVQEGNKAVLPLQFAPAVMAITASTSGLYFNMHFRRILRLSSSNAGIGGMLFSMILPSAVIYGVYNKVVVPAVIAGKVDCPICFETKLALAQAAAGVVLPLGITWTQFTGIALNRFENLTQFFRATAPKWTPLTMLVIGSMSVAMAVGSQMQSCYENCFIKESDSMLVQRQDFYGTRG